MPDASFTLPPLPFDTDALAPALTAATFGQHHAGHHKAYVDKLNQLAGEAGMADADLEAIIEKGRAGDKPLFNNAAQHFNHAFYWQSLAPDGGEPGGRLAELIARDFGSVSALKSKLVEKGAGHFASGWAWLVLRDDALAVVDSHDADTPVGGGLPGALPLLTLDVWEHAYYLDHQRNRKAYLDALAERHLNWAFASEILAAGRIDPAHIGTHNRATVPA